MLKSHKIALIFLSARLCDQMPGKDNVWGRDNIHRGCNEEYDALFEELTSATIGEARNDIIKQMNDIIVQNYYMIPLFNRSGLSAHAKDLQGVWINGWDSELWNIAEWYRSN